MHLNVQFLWVPFGKRDDRSPRYPNYFLTSFRIDSQIAMKKSPPLFASDGLPSLLRPGFKVAAARARARCSAPSPQGGMGLEAFVHLAVIGYECIGRISCICCPWRCTRTVRRCNCYGIAVARFVVRRVVSADRERILRVRRQTGNDLLGCCSCDGSYYCAAVVNSVTSNARSISGCIPHQRD